MILPHLSLYDPETKSEGSIDPLGLVPIADRLSVSLVPGVRERMTRPRFLTLIAVGTALSHEFPDETVAIDGISPPIQVYEWYVVQALMKEYKGQGLRGLPGIEKASTVYEKRLPLNAARYLRVPSVFGFYGVYKRLANTVGVINGSSLDEAGDRLLRVWEKEQDLEGFYSGVRGPGVRFKDRFLSAINDGIKEGQVARNWGWGFLKEIAQVMHPEMVGPAEADTLYDIVYQDTEQKRSLLIDALFEFLREYETDGDVSEFQFHESLLDKFTGGILQLIEGIMAYEKFSRTLLNAFESILYEMSINSNKGVADNLSNLQEVKYASSNLYSQYNDALTKLVYLKEDAAFQNTFGRFSEPVSELDFLQLLLSHHHDVQKRKPPFGKKPWIELYNNMWILNPTYSRKKSLVSSDLNEYVYMYRTNSLVSFLKDFKKLDVEGVQ